MLIRRKKGVKKMIPWINAEDLIEALRQSWVPMYGDARRIRGVVTYDEIVDFIREYAARVYADRQFKIEEVEDCGGDYADEG